jgi:predicted DsbA family dithiol-disulfide isomerase
VAAEDHPMSVVTVFADVVCPFTHVGLRRFVQARERAGRGDVRLHVRAWPLEVVNGAPMDPDAVAHKIGDLRRQIASDLFTGFDQRTFSRTSMPALALTAAAYRRDVDAGESVALAVRDLLFERGQDVSDPAVLEALAERHGLTVPSSAVGLSEVEADHADGRRLGVRGSPHFFPPSGEGVFCPTLEIERVDGQLVVHFDEARFADLMRACLV